MPSLRARLINRYIRGKLKPLPLPDMDANHLRARMEARGIAILPKNFSFEEVTSPVQGEWQRPAVVKPGRTILYFHGGGYFFGSPRLMRPISCRLADLAEAPVFSLDYRLGPENKCPAATEDAIAAFRWLVNQGIPPNEIYVSGDSAGGGLALAMMQALQESGAALPGGAVLFSPWTDLAARGASIDENDEKCAMFTADTIRRGGVHYAGDMRLDDPRVSPLYGRFEGFPRLFICASTDEVLRDDAIRTAEKAKASGVQVELQIEKGLVHIWPIFAPLMPESMRTLKAGAEFIRRD